MGSIFSGVLSQQVLFKSSLGPFCASLNRGKVLLSVFSTAAMVIMIKPCRHFNGVILDERLFYSSCVGVGFLLLQEMNFVNFWQLKPGG